MPLVHTRDRYQQGTLQQVSRAKGPDVWVYRWRELTPSGDRKQHKRVIGTVDELKTLSAAKRATENLRLAVNSSDLDPSRIKIERMTVGRAWGHFQQHELSDPDVDRSPTTIQNYKDYFKSQILPKWRDTALEDVKSVAVEKWLRSLKELAPATRAKIRNHMSALFSHSIRHELYAPLSGINPISNVRQGAVRVTDPEVLSFAEIRSIIERIESLAIRVMLIVAAASGLRRSEIRGLKWSDCDFVACSLRLKQGLVRKDQTKLKTKASRSEVPILPELAAVLSEWRSMTPYNQNDDWVFASPFTNGKRPYWAESALKNHVRPAAIRAGISKSIGWHTFRHSLATMLGRKKEDTKVVQELMRHASSKITLDVYQQGDMGAKRLALTHAAEIFSLPPFVA